MDGARSISSVLHGRLQQLALPELAGHDVTWAQRTPASAPAVAHELAAALDDRARALGEQLAASPEPWLARQLGVLAPGASPALREEYARRAGAAAAYREAAGITNPDQAVSPRAAPRQPRTRRPCARPSSAPWRSATKPTSSAAWTAANSKRESSHGERAQATAPPDVSSQLRLTAQAEADALAAIRRRPSPARPSRRGQRQGPRRAAGRRTPAPRSRQRPIRAMVRRHPRHQGSSRESQSRTATARARPARAANRSRSPKTNRRRRPDGGASSRRTSEAVERAIARQHQAAIDAGEPWPPQRAPEPDPGPAPTTSPEDESVHAQPAQDDRAARLDELLARADQAAQRIAAQQAERQASSEYAARIEREAQAQPEAGQQAEARDGAEIEM